MILLGKGLVSLVIYKFLSITRIYVKDLDAPKVFDLETWFSTTLQLMRKIGSFLKNGQTLQPKINYFIITIIGLSQMDHGTQKVLNLSLHTE